MTLSEWSYTATVTAAVLYLVIVEVVRRSPVASWGAVVLAGVVVLLSVINVLQPTRRMVARIAGARCAPPETSTIWRAFFTVSRSMDMTRWRIG